MGFMSIGLKKTSISELSNQPTEKKWVDYSNEEQQQLIAQWLPKAEAIEAVLPKLKVFTDKGNNKDYILVPFNTKNRDLTTVECTALCHALISLGYEQIMFVSNTKDGVKISIGSVVRADISI